MIYLYIKYLPYLLFAPVLSPSLLAAHYCSLNMQLPWNSVYCAASICLTTARAYYIARVCCLFLSYSLY